MLWCLVQTPGRNVPLIQFLILALYIVCYIYIVRLFISYASPLIPFSSLFLTYLLIFSFQNRPSPFPGQML